MKRSLVIKIILFWCVVLFLGMLLQQQIDLLIVKHFGDWAWNDLQAKILYVIIVLLSVGLLVNKVKVCNGALLLNCLCVCGIYSLFRFDIVEHTAWSFLPLWREVKYADAIWLLLIISGWPCVYAKLQTLLSARTSPTLQISNHNAITQEQDDKLGYAKDADNLLNIIVNNAERAKEGAVIIGLTGKWGGGKTSYLNLMKRRAAARHDVILIRMNVWQYNSYENMAKRFLAAIADGIDDITLKNLINNYSQALIDADISYVSKLFGLLSKRHAKQPEELFNIVSNRINALNKCLIVQVDDLDRLTGQEILYTLKFIRNIASFRNTFFIVAYDNEYLREQFKQLRIEESYLDKIFNVVYPLPSVKRAEYVALVSQEMVDSLMIDENVEQCVQEFMDTIEGNISLRNAKRLASSIQCGLSDLKDENGQIMVDLLDYMLIQYLQQVSSRAYDFLANFQSAGRTQCIIKTNFWYILNDKDGVVKLDKEYQDKLLHDVGDKENIELIHRIFQKLFGGKRNAIFGVSYVNSYPFYFNRTFDQNFIRKREFRESVHGDVEHLKNDLQKWYSRDKVILDHLIARYVVCENISEWLRFFEALLCITPKSYLSCQWGVASEAGCFIPAPGITLVKRACEESRMFYQAIEQFFLDSDTLEKDTLENLQKKLALLLYNKNWYFNYIASRYIGKEKIGDGYIFDLYWGKYWQKVDSYCEFDEDFWNPLGFLAKENLQDVAKKHIEEHIENFIEYYPVQRIVNDCWFQSLFADKAIIQSGMANSFEWMRNCQAFLHSIKTDSPAVRRYIQEFDQQLGDESNN